MIRIVFPCLYNTDESDAAYSVNNKADWTLCETRQTTFYRIDAVGVSKDDCGKVGAMIYSGGTAFVTELSAEKVNNMIDEYYKVNN